MSEEGEKSYHFNSNTRLNFGSKASMANNEDPYLRALEIQERKREIREQELERQQRRFLCSRSILLKRFFKKIKSVFCCSKEGSIFSSEFL